MKWHTLVIIILLISLLAIGIIFIKTDNLKFFNLNKETKNTIMQYSTTPVSVTYDFNDKTNNKAYNFTATSVGNRFTSGTLLPATRYTALLSIDNNNATITTATANDYDLFRFTFKINETASTIKWLNITINGGEDCSGTVTAFVYNWTGKSWTTIANIPSTKGTITLNIANGNSANHIGTADASNNLTIAIDNPTIADCDAAQLIRIDYIKVDVTYQLESVPPIYNLNSINNTVAGEITNFAINVSDDTALHPNGMYVFSTNNTGEWINDSAFENLNWYVNTTINASLPAVASAYNAPSVFYKDSSWYLLAGNDSGLFNGYVWSGTNWIVNTTINSSLPDIGSSSTPTVFYKDSSWYMVSGNSLGTLNGYVWDGSQWVTNLTANASSPVIDVGTGSAPNIFYKDSSWYMLSGNSDGTFEGFTWNGTQWIVNLTINSTFPAALDIGASSIPSVFYKDLNWYMISGNSVGTFNAYYFNGTGWVTNLTMNSSIDVGTFSAPSIFYRDNSWYMISGADGIFGGYKYVPTYNFTTTPSWANVTKTLNSVVGTMVGYRWYFQDNLSNTNSTPIYVITTTGDVVSSCPYTSGDWNILFSDYCNITSPVDVAGNSITISGVGTFTTTANISGWKTLNISGGNAYCFNGGCFK